MVTQSLIRLVTWANEQTSEFQYPGKHWVKQMRHDFYLLEGPIIECKLWPGALYRLHQIYEVDIFKISSLLFEEADYDRVQVHFSVTWAVSARVMLLVQPVVSKGAIYGAYNLAGQRGAWEAASSTDQSFLYTALWEVTSDVICKQWEGTVHSVSR